MEVFESHKQNQHKSPKSVVVIGNFDGVHSGHMVLIDHARQIAEKQGLALSVLTFEPHPRRLFQPDEPPNRITPKPLKIDRLEKAGVDAVFMLPFNWDFASQSPQEFIQDILIDGIGAAHVVIGYDFKFGQLRKGTPKDIELAGISTTVVEQQNDDKGEPLSSSRIRQYLRQGKLRQANEVLGWDWEIWGEVVKGDQRGRELGYPTANYALDEQVHPRYGIYAARVQIKGEDVWHNAAVNIGIRPMFESKVALVETYIFDFNREIYGETLKVQPVEFIRGEAKFDSLDELIAQMGEDCLQARKILGA